jgi:FkbM family methyltransferase
LTFVSYAQNFEDVLLWRALRQVRNGFYIDVGAAHPDIDSVTRAFYDRGWNGINVEPTQEHFRRLAAARQRDLNLPIVLGEQRGSAELLVVDGTGLSTLDLAAQPALADAGFTAHPLVCEMETLAAICRQHAPADIHFLKIDVEGAERAVLAGADFTRHRPWIVVVEATAPMSTTQTHAGWEPLLLDQHYDFVWFDGLNRFYVAHEQADALAPHFGLPPNVFDDFIRAADSEHARRIGDAERRATTLLARIAATEARAAAVQLDIQGRADRVAQTAARLRDALADERRRMAQAAAPDSPLRAWADAAAARGRIAEEQRDATMRWLDAVLASTSWRISAPLRRLRSRRDVRPPPFAPLPALPPLPALAEPANDGLLEDDATPTPLAPVRGAGAVRRLRTIHQFHSGSAVGDAITNAMLLTRTILRRLGYRSDIFVEHRDPALATQMRLYDELPAHDRYVLIVRHSMGYDAFARIAALPAPKILIYHNITPPALLAGNAVLQTYARKGRDQLRQWRDRVVAALADSEYNALELRALHFDSPQVCTLLFDTDSLLRRAAAQPRQAPGRPFTVLFVGRVCAAKRQRELVDAYAAFAARFARPSRLVLVGRHDGDADPVVRDIRARATAHGIDGQVVLTGLVSDDALHAQYAAADIFVCLSEHEGFCVPLMEAVAHGLPVLARPAGAIPFTLGDAGGLLADDAPQAVAASIAALASDPDRRASLCAAQRSALDRHRLDRQIPVLVRSLCMAGAAPPVEPESVRALAGAMRFAIAGHVNGNYSLAVVNCALALALEAANPGRVRLLPVEGGPTTNLDGVPAAIRPEIASLVARPLPLTQPEIVISQHYPVHVPERRGDLTTALFFWEESRVPWETVAGLNVSFDAVLAPSRFVAKTLVDSGVRIPVRIVDVQPRLTAWRAIAARRDTDAARPFTFLHVSSCFPRKGIDILLRAYLRAFAGDANVRLVIKGFPNPHNDAAEQLARLRATAPDAPPIELIDRDLDEPALLDLYREADAMVLPTRGEGYNLPAAEARAAGLALIVTGYGGHLDFCTPANTRLVDFSFAAARSHLSTEGSVWVEPDEDDLVAALRQAAAAGRRPAEPAAAAAPAPTPPALADIAAALLTAPPLASALAPHDIAWISSWNVRCGIAEYSRFLLEAMPESPAIGTVTVLCDRRATDGADGAWRVDPCWDLGLASGAADLARRIAVADPRIVVIQHQPGLIAWPALAELLKSAALTERIVVLTLHATQRLFDAPDDTRRALAEALGGLARIIVHTVADLNRLKAFGLIDNVVLIPQGVPGGVPAGASVARARPLPAATAAPLIGCYGFFLPDKGIPQLIGAIHRLRETYPRIRLRLVNAAYGHPDSAAEIAACEALAERLGIDDAIEWHTGFLPNEESRRLLGACDAIALPYQGSKESSSAALRFVIGAGLPVLVTPLALFDEAGDAVCRAGGTDAVALADALDRLLADPDARDRLTRQAACWAEARRWDAIARRMQEMLLGLAAADPGRSHP